jgi:tetratricopeptide (TPR) repeat protein
VSKIQISGDNEFLSRTLATQTVKSSPTQNRLLLRRTLEEAEGYTELGMAEHALHALQYRGALVHGNGRACYLLGETLRELARYEEALLPLERSAALVPDDIHVYLALGWCYKRTGQLAKAIDSLERAVAVDAGEPILHYNLACYWSLARNRTLALSHLSHALDLDANFRDLVPDEPDFNALRHDPAFQQLIAGNAVEQE